MEQAPASPLGTPDRRGSDLLARRLLLLVAFCLVTMGWLIREQVSLEVQLLPFVRWFGKCGYQLSGTGSWRGVPARPHLDRNNPSVARRLAAIAAGDGPKWRRIAAMYLMVGCPVSPSLGSLRSALRDDDPEIRAWAWETIRWLRVDHGRTLWIATCPLADLTALLEQAPASVLTGGSIEFLLANRRDGWLAIANATFSRLPGPTDAAYLADLLPGLARATSLSAGVAPQCVRTCLRAGLAHPDGEVRDCFLLSLLEAGETDLPDDFLAREAACSRGARFVRVCSLLSRNRSPLLAQVVGNHLDNGCEGSRGRAMDLLRLLEAGAGPEKARVVAAAALSASDIRVRQAAQTWLDAHGVR